MAYKNKQSTQVHRAGFPELMVGILHANAQLCRKKGMPKVAACLPRFIRNSTTMHVDYLTGDGNLAVNRCIGVRCGLIHHYLREYMTTVNEHYTSRELKRLRINASVHSSTPADFEARWISKHLRHKKRTNNVEMHKYFDGFQPSQYDSIFGAMISWNKWNSHQHMVSHKYAKSDRSTLDPNEQYQSLIYDPDRTDLNARGGAVRPAPKIPYTVERIKHLPLKHS